MHLFNKTPQRIGLLVGLFFLCSVSVVFAQRKISGKITDASTGETLPGATIIIKNSTTGVVSDENGQYSITVPDENSTLLISFTGYVLKSVVVGSQTVIDIELQTDLNALQEVVVTGYQQLRKRDITGAASVIKTDDLKGMVASSFAQNLAGRAPGVAISSSGSPGDAINIRVRGISSFTNNDPLFIIDGVPVQDKYLNSINPDDIESMQILKDASAASIYGSRASNGVVVITTKQGKAGKAKLQYNASLSIANPVKGYDDVLNTSTRVFADAIAQKFGADAPSWTKGTLPKYIMPTGNTVDLNTYDTRTNQITETNLAGTNWWAEMTRPAKINNQSISLSGGGDAGVYSLSANYLEQEGVLIHNSFKRATIRANTQYKVTRRIRVGENLMVAGNWGVGLGSIGGNNNEQSIFGDLLKASPAISLRDIKGNPGSNLNTLGVAQNFNPVARLENNKDNNYNNTRILGNIYGEYDLLEGLVFKTSFGIDNGNFFSRTFNNTAFWKKEPVTDNNFNEGWNRSFNWNWTNTLTYTKVLAEKHAFTALLGQEAIASKFRSISGSLASYFTDDINSWYLNTAFGNPGSRQVSSGGNESKLASLFAKVDYAFNDKYLLSATVRRDGSSKFLSEVRYGVFPAVSLGWRISSEPFMDNLSWVNDLKIRASYGELGNQQIRNYNFADIYGGSVGSTFYDIAGTNSSPATGYALTNRGNAATVWETAKTQNFGLDATLFNNAFTIVFDVYKRNTDNLLYNPALPGTAGASAPPFVNVGAMQNTGFDLALGYRTKIAGKVSFNTSLNLSKYVNEIVTIAQDQDEFYPSDNLTERFPQGSQVFINKVGYPISSFRGYIVDGFITTEAEVRKQVGSAIGGFRFADLNGDGVVNDNDNTIIGSPHPNLIAGWNINFEYQNFSLTAYLFGTFGNKIFNATKIQSVFMNFNSNPVKDILTNPEYPKINGLDASSRSASSFYVEDGSYVRLANLQLGYSLPKVAISKIGLSTVNIFLQGQNLFTLTKYSGVDPAVSNANIGNAGNVNDLRSGYDNGNYPSNKIVTLGINVGIN